MTIALRRVLYISVLAFFCIIGPALMLYGAGYRYDIAYGRITMVGALYIKSYPSGSSILIDHKKTNKKTPNRLLNILPGKHTITVTRDEFYSWEKKLDIEPTQTTFARDLVLFKKNPEVTKLSLGGKDLIEAFDRSVYVFLDTDRTIHLTNLTTTNDFPIPTLIVPEKLLALSPTNEMIVFLSKKKLYLLDVNTEKVTPLAVPTAQTITKILWDPTNTNTLWLLDQRKLATLNLVSGEMTERLTGIDDFVVTGAGLTTVTSESTHATIKERTQGGATLQWETTINTTEHLSLVPIDTNDLTILKGPSTTWLISEQGTSKQSFDASLLSLKDDRVLLGNDFEILYYTNTARTTELIDRSSERLTQLLWHPSGSYFVRRRAEKFEIVELDSRDVRNTTPLPITSDQAQLVFDKKGSRLFVLTPESNAVLTIQ